MPEGRAIGEALRAIRGHKGLRLVVVAERAGLSITDLHQYERGSSILPSPTLLRLLDALGASFEDLRVELDGGVTSPALAARRAGEWLLRFAEAVERKQG
jgi:transcriptional regulator with XRE-family HTH domain